MRTYSLDDFLALTPRAREKIKKLSISTLKTASKIDSIDYAFAECTHLTHLYIENNNLSECFLIFKDILDACAACEKLKALTISKNKLGQLENYQLRGIVSSIFQLTQLRILKMDNNELERLDNSAWVILFSIPIWCQSLTEWNFCGTTLKGFDQQVINIYQNTVISSPSLEEAIFDPYYLNKLDKKEWLTFLSKIKSSKLKVLNMSSSLYLASRMDDLISHMPDLYHISGPILSARQKDLLNRRHPDICEVPDLSSDEPSEPDSSKSEVSSNYKSYLPSRPLDPRRRGQNFSNFSSSRSSDSSRPSHSRRRSPSRA